MVHASALRLILAIPLALLVLDKVARMLGRREQHKVASLVCLPPGDVLELKVELTGKVDGWLAYAGKYAYVHIPDISWRVWHPFSVAHVYSTGKGDAAKHFAVFLIKAESVSRGEKKNFTNALYSLAAGGLADDML
eukprot:4859908-Pyramimonas_sp.AAC.1